VSTEPPIEAVAEVLASLVADIRSAGDQDDPGILLRIGQLDTRLSAARALAADGYPLEARLLAAKVVRTIARDFPNRDLPRLDLLEEDRAYRRIAQDHLASETMP
jgi:hypothetical protein